MDRFNLGIEVIKKAGEYLKEKINECKKLKENRYDVKLLQDIETEKIIVENIKKIFPEDSFLCEERGIDRKNKDNLWIIDPLDGSLNFSRGIPHFCISIAFNGKKEKFGIVYDFVREEIFTGIEGKGAYLNGKIINVSKTDKIEESILSIGFMSGEEEIEYGLRILKEMGRKVKKIRMFGSASLDLCYLASGRIDLLIHLNLKKWDYEGGRIILKEAGGIFKKEKINNIEVFKGTNRRLKI
ncbi:MAG TPA: inositol monophosphatase [bacterium]|nr:inositol monophosphatase [bacterium]HOM26042.1 inositol monophosphatase [bacterium]